MQNPFSMMAESIYRKLKPAVFKKKNPRLAKELSLLYPLDNTEKMYDCFQIRRLKSIIVILTAGATFAAVLHLCSGMDRQLAEGGQLVRRESGEGDYKITLRASTEDWSRKIPFLVEERCLTEKEQEALLNKLDTLLPDLIKKENKDLYHVTGDLNLMSFVEGYPFRLTWSSTNSERVDRNGNVNLTELPEEGERIELTARVYDGKESASYTYEIRLLPEELNEEETFFRELEKALEKADAEQKSRNQIFLPGSLLGNEIIWEENRINSSFFLLILTFFGCLFAGKEMENDLERNCKKRERQLLMDYPGFVSKLRMYLSAGLTMKNAFVRIASDYADNPVQKKKHYLGEEMKMACFQLENGVMEEQVYREWGRRCGEMRYRRLSFLLSVHLKQGNDQLLVLLSEEADSAQEDRRGMARKAGEEAGTKLLLPMMMMLLVVMFLVLLPAYMDFGGI